MEKVGIKEVEIEVNERGMLHGFWVRVISETGSLSYGMAEVLKWVMKEMDSGPGEGIVIDKLRMIGAARELGMTVDSFRVYLWRLKRAGVIVKVGKTGYNNIFRLSAVFDIVGAGEIRLIIKIKGDDRRFDPGSVPGGEDAEAIPEKDGLDQVRGSVRL